MFDRDRDRATELVVLETSVDCTKQTLLLSAHKHEQRQRKRHNCYRHSQKLQRSQLSNKGRDRAIQLVDAEVSVHFTKRTLQLSANEHEQRDGANETIVIVTHKYWSAVNCPIKDEIVPLSMLTKRFLLNLQSAHCCHQAGHEHGQRESLGLTRTPLNHCRCTERHQRCN